MTPPTGGPRDSLPPLIVNMNPKDSTLNFNAKKIDINFNEYVQVEELQKNLLVSPIPKVNPTVEAKLRTISITIRDTLQPNTTYALDFGNSIQDINEGNTLRNYRYVFSTGGHLDSLELAGRVLVAETGKTDSTLIVMLHRNMDDSAVAKESPRYVARLDSSGYFRFRNLEPGTFRIYALKDEGGQRRYLSKDQLFAFADSAITSQSQKNDILLYAFKALDTAKKQTASSDASATTRRQRNRGEETLKMQTSASGESQDLLTPLTMTFTEALQSFDSTKLALTDSAFKPITGYHFERDTSNKKISLVYPWPENTRFNLVVDTAFAMDTLGRRLTKNDTISFETKNTKEYGLVDLRFRNLPMNENPVLLFVQGDDIKYSHTFTNNRFYAKLFQPGDYELRLVLDANRNGKWDTGEFFGAHRQPEKVRLIPRKLNIKPNWDTEVDIEL